MYKIYRFIDCLCKSMIVYLSFFYGQTMVKRVYGHPSHSGNPREKTPWNLTMAHIYFYIIYGANLINLYEQILCDWDTFSREHGYL